MKLLPKLLGLLLGLQVATGTAQEITATVLDSETHRPIPYATIVFAPEKGVITNEEGRFSIFSEVAIDSLSIASMGYETIKFPAQNLPKEILLQPQTEQLQEVFLTDRNLSGEELMEKVKAGIKENYDFGLSQKQFFFRQSTQQTLHQFDIEVEESTIEGIDQHLIDEILANTPKETGSYKEVLGDFFGNYDEQKIAIIKAANLYNADASKNLDKFTDELQRRFQESLKKDSYLKIRSGIIGVKVNSGDLAEDLRKANQVKDTALMTPEEKQESLAKKRRNLQERTQDQIALLFKNMFWEPHLTFNLFEKSNKYQFSIDGVTQMDGHSVYILSFKPDTNLFGKRADFRGTLYVNTVDYGVHRLDYENIKPVFKFSLFGIRTAEDVFNGKMIFTREENGNYSPKYIERQRGETVGVDRPLKIIEKNKVVPGRNKQNELDLEIDVSLSSVDTYQFFIYDSQSLEALSFEAVQPSETFEYRTFTKYNPEYWEGTNIVAPNTAIQAYTTQTP